MKKICLLTICILLLLSLALTGCGENDKESSESFGTVRAASMDIQTDQLDLRYPEKWKDDVNVKKDKDSVAFYSGDCHLFDVFFNSDEGNYIETYKKGDVEVAVSVKSYEISEKEKKYDRLTMMQEDINYVLDALAEDYEPVGGKERSEAQDDVYEIKTGLATLYYPARWKDKATFTEKDNTIRLTADETDIFELTFDEKEGDFLGTYDGKDLRLMLFEVEDQEHIAMQEDINTILRYLEQDDRFQPAE